MTSPTILLINQNRYTSAGLLTIPQLEDSITMGLKHYRDISKAIRNIQSVQYENHVGFLLHTCLIYIRELHYKVNVANVKSILDVHNTFKHILDLTNLYKDFTAPEWFSNGSTFREVYLSHLKFIASNDPTLIFYPISFTPPEVVVQQPVVNDSHGHVDTQVTNPKPEKKITRFVYTG